MPGRSKVLIVDDSEGNLETLLESLKPLGVQLFHTSSYSEAFSQLLAQHFSLVIVDVPSSGIRGFEIGGMMKNHPHTKDIPILFVVEGRNDPLIEKRGYEAGAADVIFRPFYDQSVRSKVSVFITLDQKNRQLESQLQLLQSNALLDSLIENLPSMVSVKSADELKYVRMNRAGERFWGVSSAELQGRDDRFLLPEAQAERFIAQDREAVRSRAVVEEGDETIEHREQGSRILHTRKIPLFDAEGEVEYLLCISEDVTEQRQSEASSLRMIEERAVLRERDLGARRSAFLAEASKLLASSLDYEASIDHLAQLSLVALGDWCAIVTIADPSPGEEKRARVVATHHHSTLQPLLSRVTRWDPAEAGRAPALYSPAETGKSIFYPHLGVEELLTLADGDEERLHDLAELDTASLMVVPIMARDKNFGAIVFAAGRDSRTFTQPDLVLAEELGRCVGIAIDNSLLYQATQRAVQSRDDFLSIASHELKTPLTSLKLQLQLMQRRLESAGVDSATLEKFNHSILSSDRQVARLSGLVEDLLDVSRIHGGKLIYAIEDVDLSQLAQEVVSHFQEQGRVDFAFRAQPGVMVEGDRFRLEQVLTNLVSNAVKYGAGSEVQVSVSQNGETARLEVRDGGIGIAEEKQSRIFERFERVGGLAHVSGLGLGLFIVRSIVEAHAGRVWVESHEREGSCFIVELPRQSTPRSTSAT